MLAPVDQTGMVRASAGAERPGPRIHQRLLQLASKGTLAVADQALFSGANFLASIALARWLTPADYGAYSVAFAVFLLFAAAHTALLIEPMMIFGSGKYSGRYRGYIKTLLRFHVAILAPTSLVLAGAAAVLGRVYSPPVGYAFLGLAAGSLFILAFWLVRRVPYVLLKPGWGVIASLAYCAVMAGSIGLLQSTGTLSVLAAFASMAAASVAGTFVALARFVGRMQEPVGRPLLGEVAADHWRYGRWAIASALVSWFPGQVYYALLPAWIGLEGSAGLRALFNFVMPVLQAIAALNLLLLPTLVRDRGAGGEKKMNSTMLLFLGVFCAGCAVYLSALWIFRDQVFRIVYGGRYSEYAGWPLLLAGALPITTCFTAVLGNAVRALERPDRVFWAYIASALSAAVCGIPLAARFGVSGALAGIHLSSLTLAFFLWRAYRTLARTPVSRDERRDRMRELTEMRGAV